MPTNEKIADESDRQIIDNVLSQYPQLNAIITKNPNFYRLTRDQFGNATPLDQQEFRLSGILRYVTCNRSFASMIVNLEHWLLQYPEYCTKKFGRQLSDDFFSHYSEIEFYHHLKTAGFTPYRDPEIEVNGAKKKLDFLIQIEDQSVFIEVTTPRPSKEYEDAFDTGYSGFGDPNKGLGPKNTGEYSRTTAMIEKEIEKHFGDMPEDGTDCPIIIAMNIHWAALEIMIGDLIPGLESLPHFIEGILLYDGRSCGYYPSLHHLMSDKQNQIIRKLLAPPN